MSRFVSSSNPISANTLKRKPIGAVVTRHGGRVDVRFTRVVGGWKSERIDVTSLASSVVSSSAVAKECNSAIGCKESWAKVY